MERGLGRSNERFGHTGLWDTTDSDDWGLEEKEVYAWHILGAKIVLRDLKENLHPLVPGGTSSELI